MTISRMDSLVEAKKLLGEWSGNDHQANQARYLRACALALVAIAERMGGNPPTVIIRDTPSNPGWPTSYPLSVVAKQLSLPEGVGQWHEPSEPPKSPPATPDS